MFSSECLPFLATAIFLLTYVLITARRLHLLPLGRPAAALLGGTLMVFCGVVSPDDAYKAVDGNTIVLLLGMMIITRYLDRAGFFRLAAYWTFHVARSPRALLNWLALTSGVLSALLVNDTVCLLLTPLVIQVLRQARLPRFPYLMALATSSNIGSVMTLVGNPQNMIIGSLADKDGVDFLSFAWRMAPVGLVCLGLHIVLLQWLFRHDLEEPWQVEEQLAPEADGWLLTRALLVMAGVGIAFCAGLSPAWSALAGACVLLVWNARQTQPSEILEGVDWSLLLFFAGLFIAVHGLEVTGVSQQLWVWAGGLWDTSPLGQRIHFVWVSVAGSNLVSNVPYIKLVEGQIGRFDNPEQMWLLLAMSTTFAGNLTLLGSVANIIVMEASGEPVGFWQYLKIGLPVTLLSCLVGTALLLILT